MFYEPSELKASEKVTVSSKGCSDWDRARSTPADEIALAMTVDPRRGHGVNDWIDPRLAAVYVVGNDANALFKVGYARDLRKRVLSLKGSSPVQLRLHHFVYVVGCLVAKVLEADMHAAFGPERRHGEWFELDPSEAGEIMRYALQKRGYVWWDERGRRDLGYKAGRLHKRDWERYSHRGRAHD